VVDNIERRSLILHILEELHKTHDVLGVVEIARAHILNLHNHSIEACDVFSRKLDVVGQWRELSVSGIEYDLKVSPLSEDFIHVSSALGVPAILCAEAADTALMKSLVELIFK
jgi:hypothetical protein